MPLVSESVHVKVNIKIVIINNNNYVSREDTFIEITTFICD